MNTIEDKTEWDALLKEEFEEFNDVYFTYEYHEIYSKHYHTRPEGIFWEDSKAKIFWTHLVRDVGVIPAFKGIKHHDLITPYGYGGPILVRKTENSSELEETARKFIREYEFYCRHSDYVCEFIRFHPLFNNWKIWDKALEVEYLNDVVTVDLSGGSKGAWGNISKGHRYNVNKTIEKGCEVEILHKPAAKDIEDFTSLYYGTMEKNKATEKYYFSASLIRDHFDLLNSILVLARHEGETIGASIFICGDHALHYHLSGSTTQHKGVYPSDLILWETIKWAEGRFTQLNLGGGRGKNDSLFSFKNGFSNKTAPFYVGKKIFDPEAYTMLERMNPQSNDAKGFFPSYRMGFDTAII